jgi:allantoin racemase
MKQQQGANTAVGTTRVAVIGSGTRTNVMPPHLAELQNERVRPELYTTRIAAFAGNPYDRLVVDVAYVDAAQRAETDGMDVVLINTFADYGIDAMRSVVRIPVVGAGEAAIAAAAAEGRSFSIVTVWPPSMRFLYDERLGNVAGGARCSAVRHISAEDELAKLTDADGVQQRMGRGEASIIERVVAECLTSIREDGAQSIMLGCTCMAPIGAAVAARVPVPVIECSRTGFGAAVRAAAAGVGGANRVYTARPTLVPELVDAFVGAASATTAGAASAECPVCIDVR